MKKQSKPAREQPGAGGRPTKLTKAIHERLVQVVEIGNYLETAAALAGIDAETIRRWVKRGERERARIDSGKAAEPEEAPFLAFALDMQRAEALPENKAVQVFSTEAANDWRAAQAWLEKRYPERWGSRSFVKQDITHSEEVMDLSLLSPAELKQLRELRRKAVRRGDATE